jgi:hypothetical protein
LKTAVKKKVREALSNLPAAFAWARRLLHARNVCEFVRVANFPGESRIFKAPTSPMKNRSKIGKLAGKVPVFDNQDVTYYEDI